MGTLCTISTLWVGLCLQQPDPAELEPVRVSVCVYHEDVLDPGLTDLVNSQLSNHKEIEVLERTDVELIFNEWSPTCSAR